jgi:hypothetical protein
MQIQDHDEFPKFDHRALPPATGRTIGDSARLPTIPDTPGMVGSHEKWGIFKCHKWGELLRHSQDGSGEPPSPGRNGEADFRKTKRSNETHASTTDPDARLFRRATDRKAVFPISATP